VLEGVAQLNMDGTNETLILAMGRKQSTLPSEPNSPPLKRVLGRWDLVLLFVVAVFNLNVVPSIAANGGITIWLWVASIVLFFWPQGIAVIELSQRYPGEGGVYLWAKEEFGDFHGFLSGWCYWTNQMLYVPTVTLYFVGVSVYVLGSGHEWLADDKAFALTASLALLALLTWLNIIGLGVGKWINNAGAIGTGIAAAVLIGLGIVVSLKFGTHLSAGEFRIPSDYKSVLNSFGVICFGLVGLELASVMGDEIRDPARTLPGAVAWGGIICGVLYIATTLILLIAIGEHGISILEGIVEAVGGMAQRVGIGWIGVPFALMLSIAIAGIASAWMGGAARIPFVAGLDSYMPDWMGKIHASYRTPYAALIVQFVVSAVLVVINLGFHVQETFQRLLSLAVVLQLVPFLYMFAALIKYGWNSDERGRYSRGKLLISGWCGLVTTALGIGLVFFPAQQITSLFSYELWMIGGTAFFIALAGFFYFVYGRRKVNRQIHARTVPSPVRSSEVR
jgi:glutamate:GABA antiporter